MKKKFKNNFFLSRRKYIKVCLIMRLTLVLMAVSLMQVYATGYTQSARISLTLKNVSLKQALKEIEKQSDYTFVYSDSKIDVNKKIDINVKDCDLVEVLDQLVADSEIRYTSVDNHIVLTDKKKYIYRLPAITHEAVLSRETMDIESLNPIRNLLLQQVAVSGIITSSADGQPLPGVNVVVKGTTIGTTSDINGSFTLNVPDGNSILVFSFVGFQTQEVALAGQKSVNVVLTEATKELQEIVVVGYGTQKKKDITGSVSVIDADALKSQPASSLGKQMAGRASGVTVSTSGDPSAGTSIRIRGVSSVNDNGPLIVIDGVSTRDQNLNNINPNDVESIQILKDASASSIYGAQASNGVVIITTKKGSKDKTSISYNGYYGIQKTTKWYDLLDTKGWVNMWATATKNTAILKAWGQGINTNRSYSDLFNDASIWKTTTETDPYYTTHPQFGNAGSPTLPEYIIRGTDKVTGAYLPWSETNRITKLGDTDWFKEITQVAPMQSHQLTASGGGEKGVYSLGLNYYDQEGVMKYTYLNRYSIRANSEFNIKKHIKVGENFTFSREEHHSDGNQDEGWGLSFAYRLVPWVPVYDENGQYAGSGAKGAGNSQNPLAYMYRRKDNKDLSLRTFGNIYAEINFLKDFTFRSSFGIDYKTGSGQELTFPRPEHSEATFDKAFKEYSEWKLRWVYSNTLTYNKVFNDIHRLNILAGTESIRDNLGRHMEGQRFGYLFIDDKSTWTLGNGSPLGMTNDSYFFGDFTIFGILGRADYSLMDKYLVTAIVRRDGVSRFSEKNRYGTFPSISLGWRLSQENFMKGITAIDDLKLRVGYGITGNAEIPNSYNYAYTYGTNSNQFNYDISGSNNSAAVGMRMTKYGNVDTKWEQSKMTNIGVDGAIFNHALEFNVEWYVKKTTDMLVQDAYTSLAGQVNAPYVNIGEMKNTGFDISLTHRGSAGDFKYDITANISHYKNEIVTINGNPSTKLFGEKPRFDAFTVLTEGQPISAFYGYKIEGIYKSKDELANHATQPGINNKPEDLASNAWRASLGKFKFQDTDGNGVVDGSDKTIIGNPHPDFTYGIDVNLYYKNLDFNMFFVGSQGNDIFNYVKYWTDFNGSFVGNKSQFMVDNSWNPDLDATKDTKLPILVMDDNEGANNPTSYYVEDGSFFRCRNMQVGYTLPSSVLGKFGIDNVRLYLQASNLFTITNYTGLEPDLGTKRFGGTGITPSSNPVVTENGEWNRGVDYGSYPQPHTYMIGVSINF